VLLGTVGTEGVELAVLVIMVLGAEDVAGVTVEDEHGVDDECAVDFTGVGVLETTVL